MTGFYILTGGMVLFGTIIGVLDLIGRRQKRRAEKG